MTETLAHRYSSESTQGELLNEYQHDRVYMAIKNLLLWAKVALAFIGRVRSFSFKFINYNCLSECRYIE